ncbi:MAG: DUF1667 domain-containing protein [Actinobacteria bacterium]|nr:DUF1667 domain-containing protein [Actinomycetota bacterium]
MKKNIKNIRCLSCPEGCVMNADYDENESRIISLGGYKCKKGISFAEDELNNPQRILTTTVAIDSVKSGRLPVRSSKTVPKSSLSMMIKEIKKIKVKTPVTAGEILAADFMGSGTDIISSATFTE